MSEREYTSDLVVFRIAKNPHKVALDIVECTGLPIVVITRVVEVEGVVVGHERLKSGLEGNSTKCGGRPIYRCFGFAFTGIALFSGLDLTEQRVDVFVVVGFGDIVKNGRLMGRFQGKRFRKVKINVTVRATR